MNRTDDLTEFDDLREVFDRAMADVAVPAQRLQQAARRDGRRRRVHHHALVGASGLAAAAAVGAFLVPLAGGGGTTARDPGIATKPTPTSTPSEAFVAEPGWWDMPAKQMRDHAVGLLPAGVTITSFERKNTEHGPGESDEMIGVLDALLAGPAGPGSLEVMLYQLPDGDGEPLDILQQVAAADVPAVEGAGLRADGTPATSMDDEDALTTTLAARLTCPMELSDPDADADCTEITDADGRVIGRTTSVVSDGVTTLSTSVLSGGGIVYAATANSTQRKWTPPASATEPPLTADDVTALALSDSWVTWAPPAK